MASTWRAGRNENAAASTSRTGSSCRRRSRTSTGRPSFARSSTDLPLLTVVGASSTSWSSQLRRSNRARRFGSAATPKTTNIRGRRCRRHWQQRRAPPAFDASGRGIPVLSRQHGRSLSQRPRFNRIRHRPRIGGCGRKFPQHHCERVSACRSIPRTLPFGWRGPRRNSVTSLSEMNGAGVITSIKTGNPGLAWYVRKSGRSGSPVETEAT